jgi:lysozyme
MERPTQADGSVMTLTQAGRKLLMEREGCKLTAYKDTIGVLTIGVGHTSGAGPPKVKSGMKITQTQAEQIFADDVAEFEDGVSGLLERPAAAHEFDAYVSLAYNIGLGAFAGSTTLKKFNAGDVAGAAEGILMWNIPHEIKARRRGEHQQFLNLQMVARA